MLVLHPQHVQIPRPTVPPPHQAPRTWSRNKSSHIGYVSQPKMASSPLHGKVIPSLEADGLVAAYLSKGLWKWQGIVRVPEKDENGQWGPRHQRRHAINERRGIFRQLELKCIVYLNVLHFSVLLIASPFLQFGSFEIKRSGVDIVYGRHRIRSAYSKEGLKIWNASRHFWPMEMDPCKHHRCRRDALKPNN